MDFGEWIRSLRKAKQFDIKTLASLTGVEASTISRVENARTQVMLSTAIRICEGLGVTGSDLLSTVKKVHVPHQEYKHLIADETIPTIEDAESFLNSLRDNPHMAYQTLSNLLNRAITLRGGNAEKNQSERLHTFDSEEIHDLLFYPPIYLFEVQYPPDIKAEDILTIYEKGGALTLIDIRVCIKKIRREKQVTLAYLENAANISSSVLSRIETGLMDQVKLSDILSLDEQLEQNGKLLLMYWKAYKLSDLLSRFGIEDKGQPFLLTPEQYEKLVYAFITLHRWQQQLLTAAS